VKTNDDALDALRYFIFWYKPEKAVATYKRRIRKLNKKQTNRY